MHNMHVCIYVFAICMQYNEEKYGNRKKWINLTDLGGIRLGGLQFNES